MHKNILVIGGTRYFGKLLVQRLLQAGHRVTIATRGLAPDPFGAASSASASTAATTRPCAPPSPIFPATTSCTTSCATAPRRGDLGAYLRRQGQTLHHGLDHRRLPPAAVSQDAPFAESALNVLAQPIDTHYPWHDPKLACDSYVAGKLQAEAYFYRDGSLPVVSVRIGHVLAGADDFTGRLAHYVDLLLPLLVRRCVTPARRPPRSFMSAQAISDFLVWTGAQDFKGPVNAACEGALSAFDIFQRVGMALDEPVRTLPASKTAKPRRTESLRLPVAADGGHQPRRETRLPLRPQRRVAQYADPPAPTRASSSARTLLAPDQYSRQRSPRTGSATASPRRPAEERVASPPTRSARCRSRSSRRP